jgi:hypothetical protein
MVQRLLDPHNRYNLDIPLYPVLQSAFEADSIFQNPLLSRQFLKTWEVSEK